MGLSPVISGDPVLQQTKRARFSRWISAHGAAIGGLGVFLGLAVLDYVFIFPLIQRPADKDTASVVAAAITVNGAFLAAAVTYMGLVFKRDSDRRTEALALQTSRLAQQEGDRLQIEAAMKAVGLLATSDGRTAPEFQASALLVVLAQLGYLEIALDLAAELWPNAGITRSSALELINRGLLSSDPNTQLVAAKLLKSNTQRLVDTRDVALPNGGATIQIVRFWPESASQGISALVSPEARQVLNDAEAAAARRVASVTASITARNPAVQVTAGDDQSAQML